MEKEIGAHLRAIRKQKELTLMEVAKRTGLSIGFLSNLERDMSSPTLDNLQRICEAMDISLIRLLEEKSAKSRVIRADEREQLLDQPGQIRYEAVYFGPGKIEGVIITVAPHCNYENTWSHAYDEMGLILEGTLCVHMDGEITMLYPGDSFYIEAMAQHSFSNPEEVPCVSYWVKPITDNLR